VRRLGLAAVLAVAAPAALAQTSGGPTFGSRTHFTEQGGAAIYASVCAACHMPNGLGASGAGRYPSLARDASLATAAYPIDVVVQGQKAMPSFAATLTDQQIADAINYVRTHFGNAYPDAVTPAAVAIARSTP
jgi:mono/diheme cytochrome c family protein